MPNEDYHRIKIDRFRTTAEFLYNNPINNPVDASCDPNVQDFFYAIVHDAERFLFRGFTYDSEGHGRREAKMNHWVAVGNNKMERESIVWRNRGRYPNYEPLFDQYSRFCYDALNSLREDVVYGETHHGGIRHATTNEVDWARHLSLEFSRSLARHEVNLIRNGYI